MENNTKYPIQDNHSLELACAKIAHEIKNPLAVIGSILQVIELQQPDVKTDRHWKMLYHELDFISALLNDFNSLSCAQPFDFKDLDLGELISDLYDHFEPYALQNNVSMCLTLPDELFNISGDEIKLIEAFSNVIKNAIEAVQPSGHVHVSLSSQEEQVLVTIKDNGCGIEDDQLTHIFHPFISFKKNGTGLGLPIVASIIEKHEGLISVDSIVGKGTKFNITLPLLRF